MKISTIARNKFMLPLAAIAIAAMFALTGCMGGSNAEVIDKLDKMQAQMNEMENRMGALEGEDASSESSAGENAVESDSSSSKAASDAAAFKSELKDIEKRADAAVKDAENAAVPQDMADRPSAYRDAKAPLNKLDNELDLLDDKFEAAHRGGTITQDEFWELENLKEQIENKLDAAEDSLEHRMGIDD